MSTQRRDNGGGPRLPNIPGVGAPIPPTDPARAALYQHPRPTMQVGHAPGVPALQTHHYQQQPVAPVPPTYPPGQYPGAGYPTQQQQPVYVPPGYRLVPESNFQQPEPPPMPPRREAPEGPPVRGLDPYTAIAHVEIAGRKYGLRDLGPQDAFEIYDAMENAFTWGVNSGVSKLGGFVKLLRPEVSPDPEVEATRLPDRTEAWILPILGPFLGFRYVREDLCNLIASVFLDEAGQPLRGDQLKDSRLFPWREMVKVREAFKAHPDMLCFFGWWETLKTTGSPLEKITQRVEEVVGQVMSQLPDPGQPEPSSTDGSESS